MKEFVFTPKDYDEWVDIRVKSNRRGHDVNISVDRVDISNYRAFPCLSIEVHDTYLNIQGCGYGYEPFGVSRISVREGLSILGIEPVCGLRKINEHKFV